MVFCNCVIRVTRGIVSVLDGIVVYSFDAFAKNLLKLAQLPYQILQGRLSCFGSLKRFTVEEKRMHQKD